MDLKDIREELKIAARTFTHVRFFLLTEDANGAQSLSNAWECSSSDIFTASGKYKYSSLFDQLARQHESDIVEISGTNN